jgi:NAD-dependent dihydropyrimidine dehydrogenase PreA subunit
MVELSALDYKPAPIDGDFLSKSSQFPVTGTHEGHDVFAQGMQRMDANGTPYPTQYGIHGRNVAVDWESCIADGQCSDVCPVNVFGWAIKGDGQGGSGNDTKIEQGSDLWNQWRTDKIDPIRESDCIFCMACETVCPTVSIKITPK